MSGFAESGIEQVALEHFQDLGWEILDGSAIGPDGPAPERTDHRDVLLRDRLRNALARLNPGLPTDSIDQAIDTLIRAESADLMAENLRIHTMITTGIPVDVVDPRTGRSKGIYARVVDFDDPLGNDFAVVSQLTVAEDLNTQRTRRPDLVAFVNGVPLGLLELKRPELPGGILKAWNQITTYAERIPSLLSFIAVCVVADGMDARMGAQLGSHRHWAPWKSLDGSGLAPKFMPGMEVMIRGVFHPELFCSLVRDFIVFSAEKQGTVKRVAKYHQFHAVRKAVDSVRKAIKEGTRQAGIVWHTQGSGKSLEMLFCAARLMRDPELANPTIVVLTDRNDLDDQLYGEVFAPARIQLLPEDPVQATSREHLRELLAGRASGGIIFATMQKFGLSGADRDAGRKHPRLTDRNNVVVIADEAHRTQYELKDGLAAHLRDALPNASFLAFTGTPLSDADRDTRAVFGEYIDVYDLTQAVTDAATVPIHYEARLARINFPESEKREVDRLFNVVTEGAEDEQRDRLKVRFSRVEELIGNPKRVGQVAQDIVEHWEARSLQLIGKGLIVCFSRKICVDLYEAIGRIRPGWCDNNDTRGIVKVVITGDASDGPRLAAHVRTRQQMRALKERMKDPDDPLELVIVRDMWLTGFDAPPLHTMYVDKPMRGAGLMQAIARVNRTFSGKPSGLVVDYIGIAENLRSALADYTARDRDKAGVPIDEQRDRLIEKHEILSGMLHGCPWRDMLASGSPRARLEALADAVDFILGGGQHGEGGLAERFRSEAREADRAFSVIPQHPVAVQLRDDFAFFDAVADQLRKVRVVDTEGDTVGLELALRQIVSDAITPNGVVDIYAEAGLDRPDISLINDNLAARFRTSPRPNLQLELVKRTIGEEIREVGRKSVLAERKFSDKLAEALRRYTNRSITTAEVMAELVELAKLLTAERSRGATLGLTDPELAFYDAVASNESAALGLDDETLREIARQLVKTVNQSRKLDWTKRESVRAALRRNVRRLLAKYKYPPDRAEEAIRMVVEQAERMARTESEDEDRD
ncbi:type I restriction endonuclease subunit R [Streptomyces sp. NPDC096080]|uniref:type I restriction endonuclease subunit R n=1 Tax=Streptomyces sp. NPDC096080 TaxID=3156693 RepID=UPI00331E037D